MSAVYAQSSDTNDAGLKITQECLKDGSCQLDLFKTLKIREESPDNSPETLVQDIFLGATFFIGTMATFGIIYWGLTMVLWGSDEGKMAEWRKWVKYSIIGLVLVICSYSIIRVVEYITQGEEVSVVEQIHIA